MNTQETEKIYNELLEKVNSFDEIEIVNLFISKIEDAKNDLKMLKSILNEFNIVRKYIINSRYGTHLLENSYEYHINFYRNDNIFLCTFNN